MTFANLIEASYDLGEIGEWILAKHSELLGGSVLSNAFGFLSGIIPMIVLGVILLLFSLAQTFLGSRILVVEKVILFGYVGFLLGEHFLINLFPLQIFAAIFGLAVGVFCAILGKYLYDAAYVLIAVGVAYTVLYGGYYLPAPMLLLSKGNMWIAIGVAIVFAFFMVNVKCKFEYIATAALGAFLFVVALNMILESVMCLVLKPELATAIVVLLTIFGTVVQHALFRYHEEL